MDRYNIAMIVLLRKPLLQHRKYLLLVRYGCKILVLKVIQGLTFNLLTSCIPNGMNTGRISVWTSEIKIYLHALGDLCLCFDWYCMK